MRRITALLLFTLAACATPPASERLASMYAESEDEARFAARPSEVADLERAHEKRLEDTRAIVAAGEAVTPIDRLFAASILCTSREIEDLEIAEEFAFSVAKAGDARGLRIAAEAIDCRLIAQGLPQKYGTRYGFDRFSRKWYLHPWDKSTTNAERRSMGVVPIEEALRRLEVLNAE